MADTSAMLPETATLDALGDPAQYVIVSCERAKTWLAQALDGNHIEQIIEIKSQAEALRVYTMQKQLGKDAELSASEVVRRAERCIGLAIRKGQAEGRINRRGDQRSDQSTGRNLISPNEIVPGGRTRHETYITANASDDDFEKALSVAKAQGNLTRANLVSHIEGNSRNRNWQDLERMALEGCTSQQIAKHIGVTAARVRLIAKQRGIRIPADKILRNALHLNHNRVFTEFVATLESLVPSCEMIEPESVDPKVLRECIALFAEAMKAFRKLERRLKEA